MRRILLSGLVLLTAAIISGCAPQEPPAKDTSRPAASQPQESVGAEDSDLFEITVDFSDLDDDNPDPTSGGSSAAPTDGPAPSAPATAAPSTTEASADSADSSDETTAPAATAPETTTGTTDEYIDKYY